MTAVEKRRLDSINKLKQKLKGTKFDPALYIEPEQLKIEDIDRIIGGSE